jgi:hypothetical protein
LIEEKNFYKESDSEWQVVQRKKSASFGTKCVSVFQRMQSPLKPALVPNFNSTYQMVSPSNHADGFQSLPSRRNSFHANLPGLLPFFKFPSFNTIQWPDDSYLTWFKAHGPAPLIQEVSSFSAFLGFLSGKNYHLPLSLLSPRIHHPRLLRNRLRHRPPPSSSRRLRL